jgi:ABC-type multidrug transport system ATPase subunit
MIEVKGLTKKFGNFTAVKDISFQVKAGEIFALLGPNGSGKTTLLKCITGLMLPTSGHIRINGMNVWKNSREAKSLLSYLPQRVAFCENLTAREVLEFYCRLRKLPLDRIDRVIEKFNFGFNGFANRPVSEFSGGMIQRLGIAVAFLPDTPLLLLDEPTANLDPEGAIKFRKLIATLKQEGKTILFSSHVLSDIEQLADRVAILVSGKLAAVESVEILKNVIRVNSRMRLLLNNPNENFIKTALDAGATEAKLLDAHLVVSSKPEDRLSILQALSKAGAIIERFSTEEPSLEEIYLKYVYEENSPDLTLTHNPGSLSRPATPAG